MRLNFTNPVVFCIARDLFGGSLLRAKEHQPATRASAIQVMMIGPMRHRYPRIPGVPL